MVIFSIHDCPTEWEYKNHKNYNKEIMRRRASRALKAIRLMSPSQQTAACCETRQFHRQFFFDLTPDKVPYFAGHYRGEDFFCIKESRVEIRSDPRVGTDPTLVLHAMLHESTRIDRAIQTLDFIKSNPSWYPQRHLLGRAVQISAAIFVRFLEVHPYVNGNGHMARLILNTIMGRFGFWLSRFPIHQRPYAQYGQLIARYRDGHPQDLEYFILSCV